MPAIQPAAPFAPLEEGRLVANLHSLGVSHLMPDGGAEPYLDLPPEQLMAALISAADVRIQYAVIPLWLRHPEYAGQVPLLSEMLPEPVASRLRRHYLAAVYLQRYYRPVLDLYLGPQSRLPDYFSVQLGLPSPDEYYGEIGLRTLVAKLPPPVNWWESYLDPVRAFLRALSLEKTYAGESRR